MNKYFILLFVVGLAAAAAASLALAEENRDQQMPAEPSPAVQPSRRANLLGKLMDFEYFRSKYNKQYASAVELARRAKLFMARAFAVFISGIKYMYKKSSKFLKVNSRSDWTQKERDVIVNDLRLDSPAAEHLQAAATGDSPAPAVNPTDVEQLLAENPELARLAEELKQSRQQERRKRSTSEQSAAGKRKRKLTVEDLIGDASVGDWAVPEKYTPSVPSNNPDYQQPEVFSEGADDDHHTEQLRTIPADEAKRIDEQADLRGQGYLGQLVDSLKGAADYVLLRPSDIYDNNNNNDGQPRDEEMLDAFHDPMEVDSAGQVEDQVFLDYRDTGCFMMPRSQGECGSCYVFTAIALLEYHHCRQTGKLVPFSEQYVIDCTRGKYMGPGMSGCNGGQPSHVGWFAKDYGLELAADYPYRAKQLTCPYQAEVSHIHMGHSKFSEAQVVALQQKEYFEPDMIKYMLENKGPLFIGIKTGKDFNDFGGGVDQLKCDSGNSYGHAMVLIGHGIEDGLEYWLIRNSHGVDFGELGHYKMATEGVPDGCILQVGFLSGQFRKNKSHKGKALFDEVKKRNLLAQFAPAA